MSNIAFLGLGAMGIHGQLVFGSALGAFWLDGVGEYDCVTSRRNSLGLRHQYAAQPTAKAAPKSCLVDCRKFVTTPFRKKSVLNQ